MDTRAESDYVDRRHPGLAFTYEGHDPVLLARVLPLVDFLEVTPDVLARAKDGKLTLPQGVVATLKEASKTVKLLLHGVGLSIASHDGWSDKYLELVDELMGELDIVWHSEHLGYTRVDGSWADRLQGVGSRKRKRGAGTHPDGR